MCGPCARKDEHAEKTKFCTEGCCTPKTFNNIWWGIFAVIGAIQIVFWIISGLPMSLLFGIIFNVFIVVVYVLSMLKPDELKYRSALSYTADVCFGFGCVGFVMWILIVTVFAGAATSYVNDSTCDRAI